MYPEHQERSAAVVDEPFGAVSRFERVERQPVRLEMVLLRVVHGNEQMLRAGDGRRQHECRGHR